VSFLIVNLGFRLSLGVLLIDLSVRYGPKHPDMLRTVENLVIVYRNKGRHDFAKKLYYSQPPQPVPGN